MECSWLGAASMCGGAAFLAAFVAGRAFRGWPRWARFVELLSCSLAGAVMGAGAASGMELAERVVLACALAWASVTDLAERRIPNACSLAIVCAHGACLALTAVGDVPVAATGLATSLAGVLACAVVLLIAGVVVGGGHQAALGGGDVKLACACAFSLGPRAGLMVLFLSCVVSLLCQLGAGLVHRGAEVFPFAPAFLAAIALMTVCR